MCLVDDDEHGRPIAATLPEPREHGLGDKRLLVVRPQRAEVDDDAARAAGGDGVQDRAWVARRPDTPLEDAQVLRPLTRSRCDSSSPPELANSTSVAGRHSARAAASAAYSSRSAIGSRRRSAAWAAGSSSGKARWSRSGPAPSAACGPRCRRRRPRSASPARARRPRAPARGGRSPSSGRGSLSGARSRAGAARARDRASTSFRSRTGRRGRYGGRSRPRRARRRHPGERTSSPISRLGRSGRVRSSQARTSSAVAGRTEASWNGAPSPSSDDALALAHSEGASGCAPRGRRRGATATSGPFAARGFERDHLSEPAPAVTFEDDVAARPGRGGRGARPGTRSGGRRPRWRARRTACSSSRRSVMNSSTRRFSSPALSGRLTRPRCTRR